MPVEELEWDERNSSHGLRHGLTPEIAHEVIQGDAGLVPNAEGKTGSHLLIGADGNGRFWTIVVLQVNEDTWRPITGWPSTGREIRAYREISG